MSKNRKICVCDICNKEFELTKGRLKETPEDENGIITKYMECPRCKHQFIIIKTSPETRKLEARLRYASLAYKPQIQHELEDKLRILNNINSY